MHISDVWRWKGWRGKKEKVSKASKGKGKKTEFTFSQLLCFLENIT